ncbi:MAG: SseB family protein, partial [Roseovarius sp.]|nr:SseB family protein [Roseovarius sp.]
LSDLWRLSGPDWGAFDVVFLGADDPAVTRLARVGLRFDLPRPEPLAQMPGAAPGMNPDTPPRLR